MIGVLVPVKQSGAQLKDNRKIQAINYPLLIGNHLLTRWNDFSKIGNTVRPLKATWCQRLEQAGLGRLQRPAGTEICGGQNSVSVESRILVFVGLFRLYHSPAFGIRLPCLTPLSRTCYLLLFISEMTMENMETVLSRLLVADNNVIQQVSSPENVITCCSSEVWVIWISPVDLLVNPYNLHQSQRILILVMVMQAG